MAYFAAPCLACPGVSALATLATAASAESLKIGVLNDQSGVQADFTGTGSVIAARMAVEDFGGTVAGVAGMPALHFPAFLHQSISSLFYATMREAV